MGVLSVSIWTCLVVCVTSQSCSVFDSGSTARQMVTNPIIGQNTYLGLVLPVHRADVTSGAVCGPISSVDVIKTEAFFWALRTFKDRWGDTSSLPQNGIVFDSCASADRLYENLHMVEYGSPPTPSEAINVLAYLVADRDAVTVRLGKLLNTRNTTVVSASLNDAGVFSPLVYHMSPTADQEASAVLKLLQRSKWGYVQVVYSADGYGRQVYDAFMDKAGSNDITIGRSVSLEEDATEASVDPYPVVVVIFTYADQKLRLIKDLANSNFVIVTTNIAGDVTTSTTSRKDSSRIVELRSQLPNVYGPAVDKFETEVLGKFTSAGTPNIINPWYVEFWETVHKCYIRDVSKTVYSQRCNSSVTLGKFAAFHRESVAYIIHGADLMMKALAKTCGTSCPVDRLINNRKKFNAQFQTVGVEDEDLFDSRTLGPLSWGYDVYLFSWSTTEGRLTEQKVGFIEDDTLFIDKLADVNLDREVTGNSARVVTTAVRLEEGGGTRYGVWGYSWTIAIAVLAGLGIILVIIIAALLIILVKRGAVSNYVWLYAVLLFGAFLGYLTLFAYLPIPTTATCGITRFGVGFSYGICFSVMVILGLLLCKKTELFSSTRVSNIFIAASLILLIGIELVVLVIWLVWTPPGVAYVLYPTFLGPRRTCSHFTLGPGNIIVRTVFENHLLYLIYIMLLILLVLILAIFIFMRRKYLRASRDKNESYALLAAGIGTGIGTVIIWLVWTLVGALVGPFRNDPHNYGDAAVAFGLWFTLTWLLIFLLVQIAYAWRTGSKIKTVKREMKMNLSNMNGKHIVTKENGYNKETLMTVDGRVSQNASLNKVPIVVQANGGNSYTSYEQHVETRTESKVHRPAPVPEHAELASTHQHVFQAGNNSCQECGFAHNPTALHLLHPRSEHSSHNTSLEYNIHTNRINEGLSQEPLRMTGSLQALHLIHPRSRPVSRAGSLDLGQKRVVSHGMNTRVARSEIGTSHVTHGHHLGPNVIDLRRPRHYYYDRTYYPSNYNNNVYFTGHSAKGTSVI